MKNIGLIFLLFLSISLHAQFGRYFRNQTLRIDYYHSGSKDIEYYMPDELIREGQWAGPRKNLIDPFDLGNYKFEVYDSASNKLIFSKGYSTLFLEYRATEEAKSQCGNYPESVIMPFPKKPVRVEFYSRDKSLIWVKQYEVFIDPDNAEILTKTDTYYPMRPIFKSGNPKKKVDMVFLPEGYTEEEMDKFILDCMRFKDFLFTTDPYKEYQDKFNIWAVMASSEESGTDIPGDTIFKNTLLNSNFYTFGSERYLTTSDFKTVRNAAANAPYDQIVILVNEKKYGGGGIYNFYALSTTDNESSGFLFTHELGHAFPGLGDEYYTSEVAVQDFYTLDKEPWEPNLTTLVNFDSKWKDMLPADTPVPTPYSEKWHGQVGVFEGGGYMTSGVYRPYIDCSMNYIRFNNFCPVCQRAIGRMIEYYCH